MEVSSIAEHLLFTTVRVETINAQDELGTGTSFIFSYKHKGNPYLFLVTNKHVVKGAKKGRFTFIQKEQEKPVLGKGYDVEFQKDFEQFWYGHKNDAVDVTVAPLVPIIEKIKEDGVEVFLKPITKSFMPSDEAWKKLDVIEEVVFIGYPNGIWDTKNLLPIVRKGITATPISVDFQGEKQFLIDASVFPGSSGSPVFLYNAGMYYDKTGSTVMASRVLFLGVIAEVFFQQDVSEIKMMSIPTIEKPVAVSKQMIDLGVVFKASTIVETVEAVLKEQGIIEN